MERLREAMGEKPFVILAVNVGESARTARNFAERLSLGFPLLLDRDTRAAKAWRAKILPASFLVGPDGRIAKIWRKVKVPGHAEEVLAAARAL